MLDQHTPRWLSQHPLYIESSVKNVIFSLYSVLIFQQLSNTIDNIKHQYEEKHREAQLLSTTVASVINSYFLVPAALKQEAGRYSIQCSASSCHVAAEYFPVSLLQLVPDHSLKPARNEVLPERLFEPI